MTIDEYHINHFGINVLFIGGIHGDELTSIFSLLEFNQILKENKISNFNKIKKITIINMVNESGIYNGSRDHISNDTNDINRMFSMHSIPITSQINRIKDLIVGHDLIIDVHSSPSIFPCALIDIDQTAIHMSSYFDSIGIPYAARYCSNNTIKKYTMSLLGKIGITIELNGMNKIDNNSVLKAINYFKNILFNPPSLNIKYDWTSIPEMVTIHAGRKGFIFMIHPDMHEVQKGTIIAKILDHNLDLIKLISSPVNGNIIEYTNGEYVTESSQVFSIQPENKKEK